MEHVFNTQSKKMGTVVRFGVVCLTRVERSRARERERAERVFTVTWDPDRQFMGS